MYSITKEQILEISNWGNSVDKERRLKQWFPELFETKLEVGKWYKSDMGGLWFIEKILNKERQISYGFNYREEWCYSNKRSSTGLIEATEKEVKTALENEAVKRGYLENLQNVKCLHGFSEESSQEYFNKYGKFYFEYGVKKIWIQYGSFLDICIFDNGVWAEIIQTLTKKEAEEKLGVKII